MLIEEELEKNVAQTEYGTIADQGFYPGIVLRIMALWECRRNRKTAGAQTELEVRKEQG